VYCSGVRAPPRWRDHPARAELVALYAEAEALTRACTCACTLATTPDDALCCRFGATGREPYPTPVELCEVDHALRARGAHSRSTGASSSSKRRALPLAKDPDACPLLSPEGRCTIYESRPFGCRTFFCHGHEPPRRDRETIQRIGRRIADLAAKFFPRDSLPRPFTRALRAPLPAVPPVV